MLIFISEGRLGNQLFQYSFLRTIAKKDEIILTIGFDELNEYFKIKQVRNIKIKYRLVKIISSHILKYLLNIFSCLGIFNIINQNQIEYKKYKIDSTGYNYFEGILKNITYVKYGFFQSEKFFNKKYTPILKKKYIEKANNFLKPYINKRLYKVFVHIRRGDYLKWSVLDKNPSLPINYYHEQIDWFIKNKNNPMFIFLSDDPKYVKSEFRYLESKIISENNSAGTDLAIMSLCNSAILSNSSLSWWGAYMMRNRDKIFSPKYWLGFKDNVWFPQGINTFFSTDITIR